MQKVTKAELDEVLENLPDANQPDPEACAWCHGPLPPAPHAREGWDGSLFCSGRCERKYEANLLGIDEVYG
jgi:hypothetical protein